jgi:hypothetical protein
MSHKYSEKMEFCRKSQESGARGEHVQFMTSGDPGVGKNHLWQQYADDIEYELFTIILNNEDALDIGGMWVPNFDLGKLVHFMTDRFDGSDIPEQYKGRIVLFDEVGRAPHMQPAILSIIEDRMHDNKPVGDNVIFGFSTNLADSGCGSGRIDNALQARIWNEIIIPDNEEWMDWAYENRINPGILGWIDYSKVSLHNYDAKSKEFGQCNPRAWHKLSGLMNNGIQDVGDCFAKACVAMLGSVEGMKFKGWCELDEDLPNVEEIKQSPETTFIPATNFSSQYAIVTNITAYMVNELNDGNEIPAHDKVAFITYLRRMNEPLAVFGFRLFDKRVESFGEDNPAYGQFVSDHDGYNL